MQTVFQKTLADTMCFKDIPIFIYTINYPHFHSTCSTEAAERINNYYVHNAKRTENYCRTVLYRQALDSAQYIQNTRPFNTYTFDVTFKITYNVDCLTSLYTDTYTYMGGAHGQTIRESDTWDFKMGKRLLLRDIYPNTPYHFVKLQRSMVHQVQERLQENPGSYFDDYKKLLLNTFNSNSYYLVPGGFVIYFQQYDIAPYVTGMPEFTFPLAKL